MVRDTEGRRRWRRWRGAWLFTLVVVMLLGKQTFGGLVGKMTKNPGPKQAKGGLPPSTSHDAATILVKDVQAATRCKLSFTQDCSRNSFIVRCRGNRGASGQAQIPSGLPIRSFDHTGGKSRQSSHVTVITRRGSKLHSLISLTSPSSSMRPSLRATRHGVQDSRNLASGNLIRTTAPYPGLHPLYRPCPGFS